MSPKTLSRSLVAIPVMLTGLTFYINYFSTIEEVKNLAAFSAIAYVVVSAISAAIMVVAALQTVDRWNEEFRHTFVEELELHLRSPLWDVPDFLFVGSLAATGNFAVASVLFTVLVVELLARSTIRAQIVVQGRRALERDYRQGGRLE